MSIPEKDLDQIRSLGNQAIHEIVFAVNHAETESPEDAQECLTAATINLDQMSELIANNKDTE